MTGRLAGIARHDRPHGGIETVDAVAVTCAAGVAGDYRGGLKPGHNRRQISLIEADGWQAAMAELGADIEWWQRRANLLVSGLRLPRREGAKIRVGSSLVIEVTMECDPCNRMEAIRPGLKAALMPDWRGGVLGRVLEDGDIAVGDDIRIEE
ncbi:MAG: MOSC domain-containing protein [Novosphingobium sp.]|nr:MOSC domain-containing protein [Novosphingobium sp.]MCP5389687.1 MOSC domain-containing protein [Novosphingobium sp.]